MNNKIRMPGDRRREIASEKREESIEAIKRCVRELISEHQFSETAKAEMIREIQIRAGKVFSPKMINGALAECAEMIAEETIPKEDRRKLFAGIVLGKAAEITEKEIGGFLDSAKRTIDRRIDTVIMKEIDEYFHGNAGKGLGPRLADSIDRAVMNIIESQLKITISLKGGGNHATNGYQVGGGPGEGPRPEERHGPGQEDREA